MAFAFAQNPFVIHPALVSPPELPTIDLEEAWKHPPLPSHQTILRYEIRQAEIAINHITDGEERGPIIPSPEEIDRQEKVSRFETLLTDALTLIRTQGAYTIFGYTQFVPWPAPAPALNTFYIQRSFTCAQKLLIEDRKLVQMSMTRAAALETFDRLWEVTIQLVDTLVETGVLTFEAWVWGVYGLTPGYRELDRDFDALKTRMQKGLKGLAGEQTIEEVWARERTRAGSSLSRVEALRRTHKHLHRDAARLFHSMKRDWRMVRMYYLVRIVQRWLESAGWTEKRLAQYGL